MHARGRGRRPGAFGQAIVVAVVVFLAFVAGAVLAWKSFGSAVGPAYFYPSAGVTVAAMILTRRSVWPGIVAAIVVGEILVDVYFGSAAAVGFGYAMANVAEPLIGASLVLAWCSGPPDLRRRTDFLVFLGGACIIAPVVGAMIGGTTTTLSDGSDWLGNLLHWWAGDSLGILVVATPILLWPRQAYVLRRHPVETVALLAVTAAVSVLAFWSEAPPSMLILPVLAWAALRLNMIGAAAAGVVTAFVATTMTSRGRGIIGDSDYDPATRVALTQLFVGVLVTVALLVAQEASTRVQAVRERETERRERVRLQTLSRLAQQLSAALTPDDIGRALEHHVVNEAGAKTLNLGLLSRDGHRLNWVVMSGYPPSVVDEFGDGVAMSQAAVATDAVRTGEPVLIHTVEEYARHYPDAMVRWLEVTGVASLASLPLSAGGKPFGTLVLMWGEPQPFDAAQVAYISAVATMVSQALVRSRAYADEHARAAVLQSALLPSAPHRTEGLDVCVTYEPADFTHGLGGDWYDVMDLGRGLMYFAVGDVIGHGLRAVEDMAQLRSAGRALAFQGLAPARLLAELNGFTRDASQGKFATMAVVVYDAAARTLSYGSAGHPPALLRRVSGEVIRLEDARGPVLGPLVEASYTEQVIRVQPGDILILYTDGLVERRGMDIDTGLACAERLIADWDPHTPLTDECEVLHETLAPRPRADDVCIVAVRFVS